GGNRKVSNYSGITVDSGIGELTSNQDHQEKFEVCDLPGIYSLNPESVDEGVSVATLLGLYPEAQFHKIIMILDWQRLEASLSLALSLLEIAPHQVLLVVNKDDQNECTALEREKLQKLIGAPVLTMSALKTDSQVVDFFIRQNTEHHALVFPQKKIKVSESAKSYLPPILAGESPYEVVPNEENHEIAEEIDTRLQKARKFLNEALSRKERNTTLTDKIDRFTLHPILGGIIFVTVFYLLFNSLYTWAGPLMDFTEGLVLAVGNFIGGKLPEGSFRSLLVDGVFGGVGGVVVFLPQIMILLFLISLFEQSGYIARAALITDRLMSYFGLGGKAFLPYMSGFACAIPGIMAARTIPHHRERMATILTLPLITCSARLPVYILLIGTFVPDKTIWGVFNSQALSFFFLYFLGSFVALIMAKVFRLSFFKGKTGSFLIDLPPYQAPNLKVALKQSWIKGKSFLRKAGTIILGLSIIIWVLSNYPKLPQDRAQTYNNEVLQSKQLEYSMLGKTGKALEPVLEPLGMNWKMGVGLLVSFGARELFVSAMGTIYA
ncbi:MAG: ferrous iron transport protein B, partial [Halobacteriovoraceae bacterium]|nr:ferrous iron transport protein B [Halobacteriovoraceae bacterium]